MIKLTNLNIHPTDKLYAIFLKIDEDIDLSVGKHGEFHFPKGMYVYIGSAKRNLVKRLERHISIDKKKRWHFDYIRPYGTIIKIITYDERLTECELAQNFLEKGKVIARKMGSTDCSCSTHFIYLGDIESY